MGDILYRGEGCEAYFKVIEEQAFAMLCPNKLNLFIGEIIRLQSLYKERVLSFAKSIIKRLQSSI